MEPSPPQSDTSAGDAIRLKHARRFGVVLVGLGDAPEASLRYLLVKANSMQGVFQFEIYSEQESEAA